MWPFKTKSMTGGGFTGGINDAHSALLPGERIIEIGPLARAILDAMDSRPDTFMVGIKYEQLRENVSFADKETGLCVRMTGYHSGFFSFPSHFSCDEICALTEKTKRLITMKKDKEKAGLLLLYTATNAR